MWQWLKNAIFRKRFNQITSDEQLHELHGDPVHRQTLFGQSPSILVFLATEGVGEKDNIVKELPRAYSSAGFLSKC